MKRGILKSEKVRNLLSKNVIKGVRKYFRSDILVILKLKTCFLKIRLNVQYILKYFVDIIKLAK